MELSLEKKLELKVLISKLNKVTAQLESQYKNVCSLIAYHAVMVIAYLVCGILSYLIGGGPYYTITIALANLLVFCSLYAYSVFIQNEAADKFKDLHKEGLLKFEQLVNYVDWQAFRKKQLYNETDNRVLEAVRNFSRVSQAKLSPNRVANAYYKYFATILIVSRTLTFFAVATFHFRNFRDSLPVVLTNLSIDYKHVILFVIVSIIIYGLLILYRLYVQQSRIRVAYFNVMNDYLERFSSYCRMLHCFAHSINYKDNNAPFVPEVKSLLERFDKIGQTHLKDNVNMEEIDYNKIAELSENVNHLRFYIEEKMDFLTSSIEINSTMASELKEYILEEAANCYGSGGFGSKVDWNLILRISKDLYSNRWQKIKMLPFQFYSFRLSLKSSKNIVLLSICMLVVMLLSIFILTETDNLSNILTLFMTAIVFLTIMVKSISFTRNLIKISQVIETSRE